MYDGHHPLIKPVLMIVLSSVLLTSCRPNTFSHQHATAMHWATWGGHTEIVKLLLEHKASVLLNPPVRVYSGSPASLSSVYT